MAACRIWLTGEFEGRAPRVHADRVSGLTVLGELLLEELDVSSEHKIAPARHGGYRRHDLVFDRSVLGSEVHEGDTYRAIHDSVLSMSTVDYGPKSRRYVAPLPHKTAGIVRTRYVKSSHMLLVRT